MLDRSRDQNSILADKSRKSESASEERTRNASRYFKVAVICGESMTYRRLNRYLQKVCKSGVKFIYLFIYLF